MQSLPEPSSDPLDWSMDYANRVSEKRQWAVECILCKVDLHGNDVGSMLEIADRLATFVVLGPVVKEPE